MSASPLLLPVEQGQAEEEVGQIIRLDKNTPDRHTWIYRAAQLLYTALKAPPLSRDVPIGTPAEPPGISSVWGFLNIALKCKGDMFFVRIGRKTVGVAIGVVFTQELLAESGLEKHRANVGDYWCVVGAVDPEFHGGKLNGKGIYRQLCEARIERACELGCPEAFVRAAKAEEGPSKVERMFDSLGFEYVGEAEFLTGTKSVLLGDLTLNRRFKKRTELTTADA